MASLTGQSVASSYKDLLQVSNSNSGIDGTARVVSDGEDTASKLFLDTNRVGVGIAPTDGTLHVHTASAGSVTPDGDADDLVVENSASGGISILTPDANPGRLAFGSPSDAYGAVIMHQQSTGKLSINTEGGTGNISMATGSGVEALVIDSSQNIGIGTSSPTQKIDARGGVNSVHAMFSGQASRGLLIETQATTNNDDTVVLNAQTSTGEIAFEVNSNEKMRIDASGNVGIGNSIPSSFDSEANDLVVGNGSGDSGITIYNGQNAGDFGSIFFADGTSGTALKAGFIRYEQNTSAMTFGMNAVEKVKIDINGNVGIGASPQTGFTPNLTIEGTSPALILRDSTSSNQATQFYTVYTANNAVKHYFDHAGSLNFASSTDYAGSGEAIRFKLDDNSRISLSNNGGGDNNTIFGYQAGMNVTTNGDENTFVGHTAGVEVTTGEDNTGIGWRSIFDIKEGGFNTAVGSSSLGGQHGSTADASAENVAIGYSAMGGNFDNSATTDQCVAVGALTMNGALNNADGTVAVGYKSLTALTSGERNVAVGFESLRSNTIGDKNTAVGYQALESFNADTDAHGHNTAVGHNAMQGNVTGTDNTAIGNQSAFSGTNNMTAGDNNTFIGSQTSPSSATPTNQTVIGASATGQGDNSVVLGNADVTDVYMAQDSGATVRAGGLSVDNGTGTINRGNSTGDIFEARGLNASQMKITTSAFTVTPNATFTGSISKGSGSFKIDHPLESKKDTHHLVHSFVEAPQADNIYRGKATLSSGSVEINLDTVSGMSEGTFVLLNTDIQCFTSNESNWDAVKGSVSGNILTISCQNTDSTADVSWLVIGERQDDHIKETDWTDENGKVIVEPEKSEE